AEKKEPVAVELIQAEAKVMPLFEPVTGTVQPRHQATVSADTSGRILEFKVTRGQKVKKGDVIARIDAAELEASQMRAEATLKHAESELTRQKTLLDNEVSSAAKYERAEVEARIAQANLAQIRASLAKTLVLAPFSGTVTRKLVDSGDLASPGRAMVEMEDSSALRLEIPVAESLAGHLKEGQKIKVQIDAANLTTMCPVAELAPSADPSSRTFLVKIDLPKSNTIKSGSFGRAWIASGKSKLILVPASSVVMRGQMEVVFIKCEGVARLRLVRTVRHDNHQRAVLSGISEGDQIIVNPDASLRDGSPLTTK
ncbi:MAG: efflux RND transporter periplasmic adaptor subunit, partial [Verrucomicrobiae bacterium]|nr:efflux RND transporter periplasmic adaptor subunit [Verrucomicrobiae bacterium]NNJ86443.1 efflux RND transporter periplasmic adaptor subunit [Akkermansiaceae bacterium]